MSIKSNVLLALIWSEVHNSKIFFRKVMIGKRPNIFIYFFCLLHFVMSNDWKVNELQIFSACLMQIRFARKIFFSHSIFHTITVTNLIVWLAKLFPMNNCVLEINEFIHTHPTCICKSYWHLHYFNFHVCMSTNLSVHWFVGSNARRSQSKITQ